MKFKRLLSAACALTLSASLAVPMPAVAVNTSYLDALRDAIEQAKEQGITPDKPSGNKPTTPSAPTTPAPAPSGTKNPESGKEPESEPELAPSTSDGVQRGDEVESKLKDFGDFIDVKGHWAEDHLRWAVENGLMAGTTETTIEPDAPITRAQIAVMVTRAFGAKSMADISMFIDVKEEDWFHQYIAKAIKMGCLDGFGNSIQPNQAVTRQEVATTIVKAAGYTLGGTSNIAKFSDKNAADNYALEYLDAAVKHGVMGGFPDGSLKPKEGITRAQFAVMMRKMANAYMTPHATYAGKKVDGSLMVGVENVTLNNMVVTDNVFLTDGTGTSSITISGTEVGGTVYVRGTGPNTVRVADGSKLENVVLCNPNSAVSLVVDDNAYVGDVSVQDATGSVTIKGNVGNVTIRTGKAPVRLTNTTARNLSVLSKFAAISVDEQSELYNVSFGNAAFGSKFDCSGVVNTLSLSTSDVAINLKGSVDYLYYGEGAEGSSIKMDSDASIDHLHVVASDVNSEFGGKINTLELDGDDCNITVDSGAEIGDLTVSGDDIYVLFDGGCKVVDVFTSGDDVTLDGSGGVTKVTVLSGDGVYIAIPNVTVYNKKGANVYIGADAVLEGETVKANTGGTGIFREGSGNNTNTPGIGGNVSGGNSSNSGSNGGANSGDVKGPFTLSLNPNGGALSAKTVTTTAKGVVPSLPVPHRNGFRFTGWFTAAVGGTHVKAGTVTNADITVYAQWAEVSSGGNSPTLRELNLVLASEGMPSDFGNGSAYTFGSFGNGISYSSGKLTGNLKYIADFYWYKGDRTPKAVGYYVPLVLRTTDATEDAILTVDGAKFGLEAISHGLSYGGNWIVWVPCDPFRQTSADGKKVVRVSFDPDGGHTAYSASYTDIDYTDIVYLDGPGASMVFANAKVLNGVDGAETPSMKATVTDAGKTITYAFTTQNLLETRNDYGRYGNWVGISLQMPLNAARMRLDITAPDGSKSLEYAKLSVVDNAAVASWYVDAGMKTSTSKKFSIIATWIGSNGEAIPDSATTLVFDLTNCVLAGEKTNSSIKVSDVLVSAVSDDEALLNLGKCLVNYVKDYNVVGTNVAGTVIGQQSESEHSKYLLPLKISGTTTGPISIVSEEQTLTSIPDVGAFEKYLLVPLTERFGKACDLKLDLRDGSELVYSISMDCSVVNLVDASIEVETEAPTGIIEGIAVSDCITDPQYETVLGSVELKGKLSALEDKTIYGVDCERVWVAPITLDIATACDVYTVAIDTVIGTIKFDETDFVDGKLDILCPVAHNGTSFPTIMINVLKGDGEDTAAFLGVLPVYNSCELIGFVRDTENESGDNVSSDVSGATP